VQRKKINCGRGSLSPNISQRGGAATHGGARSPNALLGSGRFPGSTRGSAGCRRRDPCGHASRSRRPGIAATEVSGFRGKTVRITLKFPARVPIRQTGSASAWCTFSLGPSGWCRLCKVCNIQASQPPAILREVCGHAPSPRHRRPAGPPTDNALTGCITLCKVCNSAYRKLLQVFLRKGPNFRSAFSERARRRMATPRSSSENPSHPSAKSSQENSKCRDRSRRRSSRTLTSRKSWQASNTSSSAA
jgi:hypothetical protein